MFHFFLPPIPRPAKSPASTRRLILLLFDSHCLEVKAMSHTLPPWDAVKRGVSSETQMEEKGLGKVERGIVHLGGVQQRCQSMQGCNKAG